MSTAKNITPGHNGTKISQSIQAACWEVRP